MQQRTKRVLCWCSLVLASGLAPGVGCSSSGSSEPEPDPEAGAGGEEPGPGPGGRGGGGSGSAGDTSAGAGAGGEDGTTEPFTVVEVSPTTGAVDVEREEAVVVTFSAVVDPDTLDADSFVVTGPAGPIAGTLEVAGVTVTFVPDRRWPVLGRVEVALGELVASVDGAPLTGGFASEFVVRDGVFGRPIQLTGDAAFNLTSQANARGDVIAQWSFDEAVWAAVYDWELGSWSTAEPIETAAADFSFHSLALDPDGNAISVFHGINGAGGGWTRYTRGMGWAAPRFDTVQAHRPVALTPDGTAHVAYNSTATALVHSTLVPRATAWSPAQPLAATASGWLLGAIGDTVVTTFRSTATNTYHASVFDPATGWTTPRAIGTASAGVNWVSMASRDGEALFAWHETGSSRARRFDGAAWGELVELGAESQWTASALAPPYGAVLWGEEQTIWVRLLADDTWTAAEELGGSSGILSPALGVDRGGNALAAWADGNAVTYRRFVPADGWSTAAPVPDSDATAQIWDAWGAANEDGEVTLIWHVADNGVWTSRFE